MLRIHDVMLDVIRHLRPIVEQIRRRDRNLAGQLHDAASNTLLNIAEGSGARGRNRALKYSYALCEARETVSNLRAADAWGYIHGIPAPVVAGMNQVIGTLVVVSR